MYTTGWSMLVGIVKYINPFFPIVNVMNYLFFMSWHEIMHALIDTDFMFQKLRTK